MNLLVLAAGLGTRLQPITNHIPKAAVPFLNCPLIEFSIWQAFEAFPKIKKFVVNTHHLPQKVEQVVNSLSLPRTPIFSYEYPQILESGGALFQAQDFFDKTELTLVMNADTVFYPAQIDFLSNMRAAHQDSEAIATLLVMKHPLVGSQFGGVWTNTQGEVLGFGKNPPVHNQKSSVNGFHFLGVYVLSPRIFSYLKAGESNLLYDTLTNALQKGEKVKVYVDQGLSYETGNPQDYLNASFASLDLIKQNKVPEVIRQLVLEEHQNEFILKGLKGQILKPANFLIPQNVTLSGSVIVGEKVRFLGSARLHNAIVLPNSTIPDNCEIEGAIAFMAGDHLEILKQNI